MLGSFDLGLPDDASERQYLDGVELLLQKVGAWLGASWEAQAREEGGAMGMVPVMQALGGAAHDGAGYSGVRVSRSSPPQSGGGVPCVDCEVDLVHY